jgi:hypothetical protein
MTGECGGDQKFRSAPLPLIVRKLPSLWYDWCICVMVSSPTLVPFQLEDTTNCGNLPVLFWNLFLIVISFSENIRGVGPTLPYLRPLGFKRGWSHKVQTTFEGTQMLCSDSKANAGQTNFLLHFSFVNEISAKVSYGGWISFAQLTGSTVL